MRKIVLLGLFQFLFVAAWAQLPAFPANLARAIDSSRIISFCECIHGSEELENAQVAFVKEVHKSFPIATVFIESNNLYLSKRKLAIELMVLDSSIKLIGYNPGYLYASFQLIKKDLSNSNPKLLQKISDILPKLDSNEAYYWYSLEQNQYDSLLQQISFLKVETNETYYQSYINQLHYDLSYLKYRKIGGDKIRDSLMFQYINEKISNDPTGKYIVFGHCGHLALKNPYHLKNLGWYLQTAYSNELVSIGNDSRAINLIYEDKVQHDQKKKLGLDKIPKEGLFMETSMFRKKKQPVYLIGSNYNFRRKTKLNYSENYTYILYFDTINVKKLK